MSDNKKNVVLNVESLSISFGGLKAVSDFNIDIYKNEVYGLIGPNGAGKTTIFNLLTGVYKPDSGKIVLDGENIVGKDCVQINKIGIARTFQNIRLFGKMSVLDNVKVAMNERYKYNILEGIFRLPNYYNKEKLMDEEAIKLLKVFGIDDLADVISTNLPYGKQRKLEIVRALATNPKLLLLDEPAAGMNENETKELMNTILKVRDEFDMTILLIEHDMKLIKGICERITVLNFGSVLASGYLDDVLNNEEVIKAYLGS